MNGEEIKIFIGENGYILENETEGYIQIMQKSTRNVDGVIEPYYNETRITYTTGLYQSWSATGYFAKYFDWCLNKKEVINYGKSKLT